jgi:hypothetical protein
LLTLAPTEDKINDRNDSIEELECVFDKFPKDYMELCLGDFNAKIGREGIFKPTIGNENLHKISDDDGIRLENCHFEKSQSKMQFSKIAAFINIRGGHQMRKPTMRSSIF